MEIFGALLAGFFTLAGIWLQNYLTNKKNEKQHIQSQKQADMPRQETIQKRKSRRGKGLFIFVVNIFVFLYVVLEAFSNNLQIPGTWMVLLILFSISVVPIYSIYLMIKG